VTSELGLRILSAAAAVVAGSRPGRGFVAAAGALAGFAAFGFSPKAPPSPAAAGVSVLVLLALIGASQVVRWSPVTEEAAPAAALLGVPAAAVAALALRAAGPLPALAGAAAVLAAVSIFLAAGCLAGAEPGWRRVALWTGGAALPVLLAVPGAEGLLSRDGRGAVLLAGLGLSLLAWLPVVLLESRRVTNELAEEVLLGLLPPEDVAALRWPWTRALERRFGRPDERREYVRSALLLAVARQQQRRRTGEPERLRQLEVLTFRTRLRRTLEARAMRHSRSESEEFPVLGAEAAAPASPDDSGRP
jgi:hypothetical protein